MPILVQRLLDQAVAYKDTVPECNKKFKQSAIASSIAIHVSGRDARAV